MPPRSRHCICMARLPRGNTISKESTGEVDRLSVTEVAGQRVPIADYANLSIDAGPQTATVLRFTVAIL